MSSETKRRRRNADADLVSATANEPEDGQSTGRPRRAAAKKTDNGANEEPVVTAKGRSTKKKDLADGDLAATDPGDQKGGRGRRAAKKNEVADSGDKNADTADSNKQDADGPASSTGRKPRGKAKKGESAATSDAANAAATSKNEKEKSNVKTITVKGQAPVDNFCPIRDNVHVYCAGNEIYDVMLNQTNVQNNNNKYYLIQLLESDTGKNYSVWQRWGRVGYDGQNSLNNCGSDLEQAKTVFCKKFYDKTGNQWADRDSFTKYGGKYDLVQIDYSSKEEEKVEETPANKDPPPESKLHPTIQELLNLICDIRAMENAVKEMKYDAAKAPLGKLTAAQIKAGYAALKEIETCIEKKDFGANLLNACNEFYTRIPHYFGMKTPPLIRSSEEIKEKIQLLEALSDIEIAIRTLAAGDEESTKANPIDKHYDAMKCQMIPLEKKSQIFKLLGDYLQSTHGQTHRLYQMELLEAFEVTKDGENEKFNDVGNRMLLWHGSRLTNWYGILSQGLRIAPPEAPVTGYMFGKGVYFADMSSKSANYCFTTREKNVGLLVLCEVALGKTRDLTNADFNADKLPVGHHSTKGVGRTIPDPKGFVTMEDGCVMPCGKPMDVNDRNAYLQYNEYIVYDTNQIKMKYLLKVKFIY